MLLALPLFFGCGESDLVLRTESLKRGLPDETSTKEIDPDDYQMELRCPKCGFEFDDNRP